MIDGFQLGSSGVNPQWLIFGVEIVPNVWPQQWAQGWRYMVVGSSELGRAELVNEMQFERHRFSDGPLVNEARKRTTFRTELGSYTMAFGTTYGEALARLFADWNPDVTPRPPAGLGTARPELGDGR